MNSAYCDIVIPVYNRLELTKDCLDSIFHNTSIPYNLILIDNASDSDTKAYLERTAFSRDNITLVRNDVNVGWVKAVNKGMAISKSPYVCIMNNDTVVRTNGWLDKMLGIFKDASDIGMVSPVFEIKRQFEYKGPFVETDYCRGHCVVVRKDVIDKIGPLDEGFGMGYYDDVDYSLSAVKAGYRCVMANEVVVEHVRNSTFPSVLSQTNVAKLQEKNRIYLESKWGRRLRLVFIVNGRVDSLDVPKLLFSLARRGHYIYIWNTGRALKLAHTNIVERRFPELFSKAVFSVMLAVNGRKKEKKRYNKVFNLSSGSGADAVISEVESLAKV